MSQRERIAMQRALAREALGKLEAVTEFFGTEDEVDISDHLREAATRDYETWKERVAEFKAWIFDESPIA
ncbi:hypothetical protein [Phaeobacter italicus]|jgi:hypothetical protein|uniref:DUF6835 domain-containing protein n=1 Tax=Phaeobacter italicus TaxID=481446 RepID=UPI002FDD3770